jgi:hypothetical protein
MSDLKGFEEFCKEHLELCQEMADEGHIFDIEKIRICLKIGIKFKREFLEEMGILNTGT